MHAADAMRCWSNEQRWSEWVSMVLKIAALAAPIHGLPRKLVVYQQKLEKVIEAEKQAARDLIREKRKDRALLLLKRKKTQEELLKQVDTWLLNVEQQLEHIEVTKKQKAVLDSLKAGTEAMKALQSEISLDDVQKLMDDTAEAKAFQDEINAALGERLSEEDEEEVLAEFENLESEITLQSLPTVPATSEPTVQKAEKTAEEFDEDLDLPDVPTRTPPARSAVDDATESRSDRVPTRTKVLEEPLPA